MSIIEQQPSNFATGVVRNVFIKVRFDEALDRATVNRYTVILVKSADQSIVDGVVDYIVGTYTITFQLFDYLEKNENYTLIIVGGLNGVYNLSPHTPFSDRNYVFSFTTGESVDLTIPLARKSGFEDGPAFSGEAGIYREVFGRTGEPVAHIVTTAAEIGPDGTIVPSPYGAERYIYPSGADPTVPFEFMYAVPADGATGVFNISEIIFKFNAVLASVGSYTVKVVDALGYELYAENTATNYLGTMFEDQFIITLHPEGTLREFRNAAEYEISLYDIEDVIHRKITSTTVRFKTRLTPFYSTVRIIRLNLGNLIAHVPDSTIELLIHENSMLAIQLAEQSPNPFDPENPPSYVNNYVTCKTKLDLLTQMYLTGGVVTRKTLADLTVEYGPPLAQAIMKKIADLDDCVRRNANMIINGTDHVPPTSAVKSKNDPRAISWMRLEKKDFTTNESS